MLEVGARERKAHHVCADYHRKAHELEEPCEDECKAKGHGRYDHGAAEEGLEGFRDPARGDEADCRCAEPYAERLRGDYPDCAPVHRAVRRADFRGSVVRGDYAVADCEDDEAEDVVDHGAGHDGHAFLGVHLLLLGEDASRYAYGRCSRHNAHVERGLLGHRLGERQVPQVCEVPEELRQQIDGAEVARHERDDDAPEAHHEADEGIAQEHLEVGLEAGEEKEYHRGEGRYAIERGRRRVEHRAVSGNRAEHLDALSARCRVHRLEGRSVEKPAREKPVAETDAAERPRSDDDARRKLPENRRELHHRGCSPAEARGKYDDAKLQYEEHHLLHAGEAEVGI